MQRPVIETGLYGLGCSSTVLIGLKDGIQYDEQDNYRVENKQCHFHCYSCSFHDDLRFYIIDSVLWTKISIRSI